MKRITEGYFLCIQKLHSRSVSCSPVEGHRFTTSRKPSAVCNQRVRKICIAAAKGCKCQITNLGALDDQFACAQKHFNHFDQSGARHFIRAQEHPNGFDQHNLGNISRQFGREAIDDL